jgi:hypothetical protein
MCVELEIEDEGNQLGEEALKKQDLNAAMQSKGGTPRVAMREVCGTVVKRVVKTKNGWEITESKNHGAYMEKV